MLFHRRAHNTEHPSRGCPHLVLISQLSQLKRIKCLAQGNNILLPGFERSTSVSKINILANRPIYMCYMCIKNNKTLSTFKQRLYCLFVKILIFILITHVDFDLCAFNTYIFASIDLPASRKSAGTLLGY